MHLQRNDDSNLVYSVETRADLGSGVWTNAGYSVLGTNVMGAGTFYDVVTNSIPMDAEKAFIRLRIDYP
jgi:hypothetical protein